MTSLSRGTLTPLIEQYNRDFLGVKTVFVIMRFANVLVLNKLYQIISNELIALGVRAVRADERIYSDQLWVNVQVHMLGADAGIAVFDRPQIGGSNSLSFNPNVSIEAGYMMGLDKPIMLLKDKYLENLPTDFGGSLYHSYDGENPDTASVLVRKWAEGL